MTRRATAALVVLLVLAPAVASKAGSGGAAHAWRSRAALPVATQEVASAALRGRIYVGGGLVPILDGFATAAQWRFVPKRGIWQRLPDLPGPAHHLQAVALDGRVFYMAGLRGFPFQVIGSVWIYEPRARSFTEGAPMPAGRERGAAGVARHGGRIYVVGGQRDGDATSMFDVYDPGSDSWRRLPDIPTAREHLGAAFVGDRLYAIAGRSNAGEVVATEAFDLSRRRWIKGLAPIPTPRGGLAVTAHEGRIYALGGEGGGLAHSEVELYDPASDRWRSLSPMPVPRHGIQAPRLGGHLWVAGGASAEGYAPSDAHESLSLPPRSGD